jgi:hypothetical protein
MFEFNEIIIKTMQNRSNQKGISIMLIIIYLLIINLVDKTFTKCLFMIIKKSNFFKLENCFFTGKKFLKI